MAKEKLPIAYLAVPYTHPEPQVMAARYHAVTHAAGWLLVEKGQHVFSPITHTHPIKLAANLSDLWEQWAEYDTVVMTHLCSSVVILCLDGWQQSVGVQAERKLARCIGLPVIHLMPDRCGLRATYPYQEWKQGVTQC